MRPITLLSFATALILATPINAAEYLRDQAKTQQLISGAKLEGVYLRSQSPYSLEFRQDGILVNQRGAQGRWWVNEQGQYCRKWETGKLKGHEACLDIATEGDKVVIYSNGKRVAEGSLARQ